MRVGDVNLCEAVAKRPRVCDRFSTVHQDDKSTLAANEIDKKLKEGIDCKRLSCLSELVSTQGGVPTS